MEQNMNELRESYRREAQRELGLQHQRELQAKDEEIASLRMQITLLQKQVDEQNSLLMFMQGEMHGR